MITNLNKTLSYRFLSFSVTANEHKEAKKRSKECACHQKLETKKSNERKTKNKEAFNMPL